MGCTVRSEEPAVQAERRTEVMLAAARADSVVLFAEPGHSGDLADFTTAGVSLTQHTFSEEGSDFDVDVDPTGKWLLFASTRHNQYPDLYLQAVDGVAVTQLTSGPASDVHPTFSPDGRRIAFASDRAGGWDIWTMNVDGGPPVQVTHDPGHEVHPSWSPDARHLVYCNQQQNGPWELWVADAVTDAAKRFIGYGMFPEWSPAGDLILFQRARERGSRWFGIWTLTLIHGEPRYPTELASSSAEAMILPTWSPDGGRIAFSASTHASEALMATSFPNGGQSLDLWVMNADGRGRVRVTDGHSANFGAVFGKDGRLFFLSDRTGHENVWSISPIPYSGSTDAESKRTTDRTEFERPSRTGVETASMKDDL